MATESIKITIAGKGYTLNADSTKRELYLLAEQRLNATITKFEKRNLAGIRPQDVVALAAFEFAVANISLKQQNEVDSEELSLLKQLDRRVEEYLNDLDE